MDLISNATNMPSELISLIASSIIGSSTRLMSSYMADKREEKMFLFSKMKITEKTIESARNHANLQLMRRIIAGIAVFFIIAWPKLVAVLYPEIPVCIGYPEKCNGFLFFNGCSKMHWEIIHGLTITPLDTHLLSAIIGLYFGSALVDLHR